MMRGGNRSSRRSRRQRVRGAVGCESAATEGARMDPDMDPNMQHWQHRLDNFQWVIASIYSQIDSIPT